MYYRMKRLYGIHLEKYRFIFPPANSFFSAEDDLRMENEIVLRWGLHYFTLGMQNEIDWTFVENPEENLDSGKEFVITLEFINTFFSHMNYDHVPLTYVLSMNLTWTLNF